MRSMRSAAAFTAVQNNLRSTWRSDKETNSIEIPAS
jgi:hypothetical protein